MPATLESVLQKVPMIRLTDLKLPLDHDEAALRAAIVARLGVAEIGRAHV